MQNNTLTDEDLNKLAQKLKKLDKASSDTQKNKSVANPFFISYIAGWVAEIGLYALVLYMIGYRGFETVFTTAAGLACLVRFYRFFFTGPNASNKK